MKKILIPLIFLVLGFGSKAQNQYSLSFAEGDLISTDTSEFNSLIPIEFYLINTGIDTIFSNVSMMYSINANDSDIVNLQPYYTLFDIQFGVENPFSPGDSVYFNSNTYEITLDGLFIEVHEERNFNVGDNIIIVWPVLNDENLGDFMFTSDQYVKHIYVLEPLSVQSKQNIDFRLFYQRQSIQIQSLKTLDNVSIYGINGKLVYKGNQKQIPTYGLSKGIYVFHIRFEDGEVQRGRVFISND